ncbi:hypothetical protein ACFLTZ_01685 [Chloroflexota bacterium]
MSKFVDKLGRTSRVVPQPMGFGQTRTISAKPKILLIVSLTDPGVGNMADCVAGADAGLLHISESGAGAKIIQKMSQAMPDVPWGGWLGESSEGGVKQIVKAGYDFVIFSADRTSLAMLQDNKAGRILEVEPALSDSLVRAINELPVDAVLIASGQRDGYRLTWHHLMLFQRFANLLTKPLLVSVPSAVTSDELRVLWEAGIDGIVLEIGTGQSDMLKELRQTIDSTVFPTPRKRNKTEALLPYVSPETITAGEDEEEEAEEL